MLIEHSMDPSEFSNALKSCILDRQPFITFQNAFDTCIDL